MVDMTSTPPTIGRLVHYTLNEQDAWRIRAGRGPLGATPGTMETLGKGRGSEPQAGQTFPAMIVRTFGGPAVNLQVFLDGDDTLWVTSASETGVSGNAVPEQGCWGWPARV